MIYRTDDLLQSIVVKRTVADVEEEDVDEPKVKKMKSMADDGGYFYLPTFVYITLRKPLTCPKSLTNFFT